MTLTMQYNHFETKNYEYQMIHSFSHKTAQLCYFIYFHIYFNNRLFI